MPEKTPPLNYEPMIKVDKPDPNIRNQLLDKIMESASKDAIDIDMFHIMDQRRSVRKFTEQSVEATKIDEIISAADTAPTAGNFQGFEIFYVKNKQKKIELIEACNNQRYVNAPIVLVFCKNPSRVKFDFPEYTLKKFAIQDATLAAGYSQLAAHALGLGSIWIGMFDEEKVKRVIDTDLVPSSILCIGYTHIHKLPKPRRNVRGLVHIID